jgi:hypothetical protein
LLIRTQGGGTQDVKSIPGNPDEDQPIAGPHYVKVTPDQKHLLITDYFVQMGDIGLINTPADCILFWTRMGA